MNCNFSWCLIPTPGSLFPFSHYLLFLKVGLGVGSYDGLAVAFTGADVGELVGLTVGLSTGELVFTIGARVGLATGAAVIGERVGGRGVIVGEGEGFRKATVGDGDGFPNIWSTGAAV